MIFNNQCRPRNPTSACQRNVTTNPSVFVSGSAIASARFYILIVTLSPSLDYRDFSATTHPPSRVPTTLCFQTANSPGRIRTYICLVNSQPLSNRATGERVEKVGIEPTTSWLQGRRSPKVSYIPMFTPKHQPNGMVSVCQGGFRLRSARSYREGTLPYFPLLKHQQGFEP